MPRGESLGCLWRSLSSKDTLGRHGTRRGMIEAVMLWNEPNNKSHWDLELDPDWARFASMARLAGNAIASEAPGLPRVLGGISPIDPLFIANLAGKGALDRLDVIAVHGFPLDWNLWMIDEWPARLEEIAAVSSLPVWVSEVGASSFGAEEVQDFGLQRTAELLISRTPRIHWYSLYDLPKAWPATTRHREAEGSSYYRHFYMGLLREDGTPKRVAGRFADYTPNSGSVSGFISRIIGSRMRCAGSGGSEFVICEPGSAGPTVSARTPKLGSTGKWGRWRISTSP